LSDERFLNKQQNEIKSGTLSKTKSGNYYFSILIDRPNKTLKKAINDVVGLDLGIKDFIVTSEGQKYENLKIKRKNEVKLSRLYRQLSRKKKGSNNKNKTRIKLAKFHEKLNNQKEYYLHQTVNQILSENQTIGLENLNVKGMMKNHKLAKSIQEVSWSRFRTILTYKAEWYNRDVILVDRFFASTKLCSECGYKNDELTLKDRFWICPICGKLHDRDINSGINIKIEVIKIKIGLSSPESTLQESKSIRSSVNEETNSKMLTEI
jgi:putative transposase